MKSHIVINSIVVTGVRRSGYKSDKLDLLNKLITAQSSICVYSPFSATNTNVFQMFFLAFKGQSNKRQMSVPQTHDEFL
jgi:hypothetical protein